MLISTAILKISDSKNLEDNHSSLALLKRIQENKQIVYENKIVEADKKKVTETLLQWVENKDLDIIIIINATKIDTTDLVNEAFEELIENKNLNVRNVQEFKGLNYNKQKQEIKKLRSIFINGIYIIELPESQQTIADSWDYFLKARYNNNRITLNDYIKNLKVKPYHLKYGQLHKKRKIDMENELEKQINLHLSNSKQSENNKEFMFVEVGSYLGESLEVWGDLLEKKLKNNFLIISIDPFTNYVSDVDAKSQENKYAYNIRSISQNMEKAYMYFINNISLKNWKNRHIHFRMNSYYGFETIKNFNIKIDFCYLDGSHYYKDFKSDLDNFSKILKLEHGYKGKICGDDYEVSYNELLEQFKKEEVDKFLSENKTTDFIQKKEFHFHPGITLAMKETLIKIKKFPSGFWSSE